MNGHLDYTPFRDPCLPPITGHERITHKPRGSLQCQPSFQLRANPGNLQCSPLPGLSYICLAG